MYFSSSSSSTRSCDETLNSLGGIVSKDASIDVDELSWAWISSLWHKMSGWPFAQIIISNYENENDFMCFEFELLFVITINISV